MGDLSWIPSATKKKNESVVKENHTKDSFWNKRVILKTATKVQDTRNSTGEDSGKMAS